MTNASGPTGGNIVMKALRHNKRKKVDEWVFSTREPQAEKRGHHPLHRLARRELQRVLLAGLLHVLAEVRPSGPGEAARRRLLRVLHRHARVREELRGVLRADPGGRGLPHPRPHGQGRSSRTERWSSRARTSWGTKVLEFQVDMVILSVGLEPVGRCGSPGGNARHRPRRGRLVRRDGTTTPTRPARNAGASSSPASARGRRTSPTPWRRLRRWRPASSRASSAVDIQGSRSDLTLADIEAGIRPPGARMKRRT